MAMHGINVGNHRTADHCYAFTQTLLSPVLVNLDLTTVTDCFIRIFFPMIDPEPIHLPRNIIALLMLKLFKNITILDICDILLFYLPAQYAKETLE
ncbi:hypothetical protein [Bartonella sp. LJL80]